MKIKALVQHDEKLQKMVADAWKSTYGAYKSYRVIDVKKLYAAMEQRFCALGLPNDKKPDQAKLEMAGQQGKGRHGR